MVNSHCFEIFKLLVELLKNWLKLFNIITLLKQIAKYGPIWIDVFSSFRFCGGGPQNRGHSYPKLRQNWLVPGVTSQIVFPT